MAARPTDGFLAGVRVLEVADEQGEYCGRLLAGLGADVIKIEPPGGERTRDYGPFYRDEHEPNSSLHFWHYNFGKRGLTLDLDDRGGQDQFRDLVKDSAVLLETRPTSYWSELGLDYDALKAINQGLILARISPFGDTGPWAEYKGSDLVHLALGGVMMNCGYDPDPSGAYETPPIAPQMWQAYQIAGEMMTIAVIAALHHRARTGEGQRLSGSVHQAVAQQTESDMPDWIYSRQRHDRRTCRHSKAELEPDLAAMTLAPSKDGRWILPYVSYTRRDDSTFEQLLSLLDGYGMAEDLHDIRPEDFNGPRRGAVIIHITDVVRRFIGSYMSERDIWKEAQERQLTWAPLRRPEENIGDPHWAARETFAEVPHPELGRSFTYVSSRWVSPGVPWRTGPRAPLLGEHNKEILDQHTNADGRHTISAPSVTAGNTDGGVLDGVRVIDLGWVVASGAMGRFLAALGADVIRVEHSSRPDILRWRHGMVPAGGRPEVEGSSGPVEGEVPATPNRSGFFMDLNAGKRSVSLNLKERRGRELLAELIAGADVVSEGFSPRVFERMGFGYEKLKEINPRIIYAQQSGMGYFGTLDDMRTYGPVAAAFSGLSELSGLPAPFAPAGVGYSYLDLFGANNIVVAILAALYRRERTGEGCWLDLSQTETGIFLTGTAVLNASANGTRAERYGNQSPYRPSAPHGAYRVSGTDRWIAIACFTDEEWRGLCEVLSQPEWTRDERYANVAQRIAHSDELDQLVGQVTQSWDGYQLMEALQARGVPAGVCQTARDRYEIDPQLKHLEWLVELPQTEIGTWPAKDFPVTMETTPARIGGPLHRHGPNYGEDNAYVFTELLGLSMSEIAALEKDGVV